VILTFGLTLLPSATADARRAAVCAKKGGKTIVSTREARVFKKRAQVYACLRRGRRAFPLGRNVPPVADDRVGRIRLRGRFVAYLWRGSWRGRVKVKELRRGRTVHDGALTVVARPGFTALSDLELKRNGSIAWIAATNPLDVPLMLYPLPIDYLPFWEVSKFDVDGRVLLDSARDIGGSLLLRDSTVYWSRGRQIRSAPLN
jgi:hypothetical protein